MLLYLLVKKVLFSCNFLTCNSLLPNTAFNRSRAFAHAQNLIRFLTQGRALFSQITLIIFIVEPPKLYSE